MTAAAGHVGGTSQRLNGLDAVRGVALLLVLASHLWPMPRVTHLGGVGTWAPPLGHVGVSLFFVLSGFLITRGLVACRTRWVGGASLADEWAGYLRNRVVRIVPAYAVVLGAFIVLGVQRADERFWWHATYASNWLLADTAEWRRGGYDRHWWSLAVEAQFYVAWPLVALLLPKRVAVAAMLVLFASGTVWRYAVLSANWPVGFAEVATPANVDFLTAGALVAFLGVPRRVALALAFVVLPVALVLIGPLGEWVLLARMSGNNAVLAAGLAGVVAVAAHTHVRPRLFAAAGAVSYGAYLVHTACGPLARMTLGDWAANDFAVAAVATIYTFAFAVVLWYGVERPALRLRGRA